MIIPIEQVATEKQIKWLATLYGRAGYLPPPTMDDSRYGRELLGALVHPDGSPNQPRDPWSQSMITVFGKPARKPRVADRRSIDDLIEQMRGSVMAGDGTPPVDLSGFTAAQRHKYYKAEDQALLDYRRALRRR